VSTILPPFLFIVGAERSGTTMLRGMVDGHPDVAVVYEPHVVTELDSAAVRHADGSVDVGRFAKAFVEHRWFRRWGLSVEQVWDTLSGAAPVYFSDAVRCVYARYATDRGKRLYGDKSPSYVERMVRIGELFPEARFVHLVRDGRDASRSLQQVPFGPDDFATAARQWRAWVEEGLRAGARLGPDRYLELRYEHLVADPVGELTRLCAFVGIDFHPDMMEFHRRADDVLRHERPNYHDRLSEPLRTGIRDWRTDLSAAELAEFHTIAGDLTERLGYAASVSR